MQNPIPTICHFTSAHRPDDVRIFHKECTTLAAAGFQVYLVATNCEEEVKNGVHIINASVPVSGRFTRMWKTSKLVYKKALSLDADVYHFHDPELLRFALRLKRKGKKVIYDAHEDVPKQIMGKFWINKYLRKIVSSGFRWFENFVSKRLDYILTATPFIKDRFAEINPNVLDINNFPLLSELLEETSWSNKKNEICYLGGITQIRGSETLIDSLEFLNDDVILNFAGKYSPQSLRDTLITKKGWSKVNEMGFVSRTETAQVMANSKVGIVTFHPLPNHVDAQPNKMFEYMSAGIPVVGSNFPLWEAILIDNNCGVCVDPEDPKSVADGINYLLSNPEISEQMGKNGRKAVLSTYNWDAEGEKLVSVYRSFFS